MKVLEITSYVGCPNMCHYCPQDLIIDSYKGDNEMTLDAFVLIMANVPKDVRIDFTGFSEIFYHAHGSQMIRYACEQGYQVVLYTTLKRFTHYDAEVLRGCKFLEVGFHQFPGFDLQEFNNSKNLFERIVQQGRTIEITGEHLWSRAGNVFDTPENKGAFHCRSADKDFDHNVVVPNGDVYICCMDYGLKHKIGNLLETPYNDLDRSVLTNLSHQSESKIICRKCELFRND